MGIFYPDNDNRRERVYQLKNDVEHQYYDILKLNAVNLQLLEKFDEKIKLLYQKSGGLDKSDTGEELKLGENLSLYVSKKLVQIIIGLKIEAYIYDTIWLSVFRGCVERGIISLEGAVITEILNVRSGMLLLRTEGAVTAEWIAREQLRIPFWRSLVGRAASMGGAIVFTLAVDLAFDWYSAMEERDMLRKYINDLYHARTKNQKMYLVNQKFKENLISANDKLLWIIEENFANTQEAKDRVLNKIGDELSKAMEQTLLEAEVKKTLADLDEGRKSWKEEDPKE